VRGIKTTIPFFQWALNDEDFLAARFDTSFIDRKLAARNGEPLHAAGDDHQELAAIAAALSQVLRLAPLGAPAGIATPSRWRDSGRLGSLR
jgi:acetyl/propionyl-CoA carboxylase alpha subunit